MENIIYEYKHDKRRDMYSFEGINTNAPRHFHRTIEILYVLEGAIECTVGNESFVAEEDDIIFVHNYYVHSFSPKPAYRKYVVIISSEHERDINKILKTSTLPHILSDKEFNRKNLRHIFDLIVGEKERMPSLVKKGYVNVVMGTLFEHYEAVPPKNEGNMEFMVEILHYIDEHYRERITLESIASVFGYNKCYFSRLFNHCIGESLSNYLNVVRLRSFMSLVKEQDSPQISKLAMECGFESMPTFYRAFSKMYGESPKEHFAKK